MDKNTKKWLIVGGVVAAGGAFWYFFFGPGATPSGSTPLAADSAAGAPATAAASAAAAAPLQQTSTTVCETNINSIEFGQGTAQAVFEGPLSQMQYAVDGKASGMMPVTQVVNLDALGLAPGPHMISMTPYCMLGGQWVGGGSSEANFTI